MSELFGDVTDATNISTTIHASIDTNILATIMREPMWFLWTFARPVFKSVLSVVKSVDYIVG